MLLNYSRLFIIAIPYLTDAYYQNRYVPAPEIAGLYHMNVRALMPALKWLKRAGILRSRTGGNEPGFMFSRDPELITFLDIINVLEGEHFFECCDEVIDGVRCDYKDKNACKSKQECVMYDLFNGIILQVKTRLRKINLKEYACMMDKSLAILIKTGSKQSD